MEVKTWVGQKMIEADYNDDIIKQVDNLAFRLYCIPISERNEILDLFKKNFD